MKKTTYLSALLALAIGNAACKKEAPQTTKPNTTAATAEQTKTGNSPYISRIYAYLPAPGQFINEGIGTPAAAQKLIGNAGTNIISLGAFGGYVIFGFDHPIKNKTGPDIGIYGNPIGPNYQWSEPGIVAVSKDANNNGLPDDPWYELAGSEYNDSTTIKNYTITYYNPKAIATNVPWKDNQGNTGIVQANQWHQTYNYYPAFAPNQDSLVLTGTKLRNTLLPGTIISNPGFAWGYTDSYSADFISKGYNTFDIAWARNSNGQPVTLPVIHFVKVYTAQNTNAGPALGEISTEIKGAVDLSLIP